MYSGVPDQRGQLHRKFNGPPIRVGLIGRIAPERGPLDFIAGHGGSPRREPACAKSLPFDFHGWIGNVADALRDLNIGVVPSKAHDAAPRIVTEARFPSCSKTADRACCVLRRRLRCWRALFRIYWNIVTG